MLRHLEKVRKQQTETILISGLFYDFYLSVLKYQHSLFALISSSFVFHGVTINFFIFIFYLRIVDNLYSVKSVYFRSYSGSLISPIWTEYGDRVSLRIQSECEKRQTRKTPNRTLFMQCLKCSKYFVNIDFCADAQ